MRNGPVNVVIGGEAGQGLVTAGYLLAKSLVRAGYCIVVSQSYESRVRGGHNTFHTRVGVDEVIAPAEQIDLLVALDAETLVQDRKELSPDGITLADQSFAVQEEGCLSIPYKQLTTDKFFNIAALGITGFVLGLEEKLVRRTAEEFFGEKKTKLAQENDRALANAYRWCEEQPSFPRRQLPQVHRSLPRMMISGNEAIALGAMSAGVKFCSFYPMSPSTSIALSLITHSKRMGVIIEQAEDEIAAANMALGASFAGALSLVPTSGGGFALMEETVSLAGVSETPLVIVVVQRPGPATGLPTRTEQADLELVLHAGHGEFPRVVFAPGTVEDCFHVTREAFEVAERFQTPVFILSDQYLADSYRPVIPFDIENLRPVRVADDSPLSESPYRRYAFTKNGVSPRLLPGLSKHLVCADCHEHTPDGHITEDPVIRKNMVDKRLKKFEGIRRRVIAPKIEGDEKPELLFVSWGSTLGAVSEAANAMRADGVAVATLHFSQVWPLVPEQFIHHLQTAKQVVCVEGNATGQFARLIRRETGFSIEKHIRKYDGRPFTAQYILTRLGR